MAPQPSYALVNGILQNPEVHPQGFTDFLELAHKARSPRDADGLLAAVERACEDGALTPVRVDALVVALDRMLARVDGVAVRTETGLVTAARDSRAGEPIQFGQPVRGVRHGGRYE